MTGFLSVWLLKLEPDPQSSIDHASLVSPTASQYNAFLSRLKGFCSSLWNARRQILVEDGLGRLEKRLFMLQALLLAINNVLTQYGYVSCLLQMVSILPCGFVKDHMATKETCSHCYIRVGSLTCGIGSRTLVNVDPTSAPFYQLFSFGVRLLVRS